MKKDNKNTEKQCDIHVVTQRYFNLSESKDDLLNYHDVVWYVKYQKSMRIGQCEAYKIDIEQDEQIKKLNYILNALKHYKKTLKGIKK